MKIREQFKQTEKLYHFTSFDTALKIIETNRLKFGRLNNMNDIHENDKLMFAGANGQGIDEFPSDVLDALYEEIYKYRQISLTADSEEGDKEGFDLHQMWGLYADKGEGVCLVFDKKELEKNYEWEKLHKGRVQYNKTEELESFVISNSNSYEGVLSEIKDRIPEIFFHKRIEWEHEQEYRLMKRCPNSVREEYLFLGHALKYVILTSKLLNIDEVRYSKNINDIKEKIKKVEDLRRIEKTGDIHILIYGNGLFDYALVTSKHDNMLWDSNNGYDIMEIADMKIKYTREQLIRFSDKIMMDILRGKSVVFYFSDGRETQICAGDLIKYESETFEFQTRTGIMINLYDIDYIEVFDFV